MTKGRAKIVQGVTLALSVVLALVIFVAPLQTPLGSVWRILPIGLVIDAVLAVPLIYSTVVLYRAGEKNVSLVAPAVIGSGMLFFTPSLVNALNALFDLSTPVRRDMELIDSRSIGSRSPRVVVAFSPWHGSGESVELFQAQVSIPKSGWQRGDKYVLTSRAGGLGRPYVLTAEPAPLPDAELVKRFSFAMSTAEVASLFDVKQRRDFLLKLKSPGVLSEVRIEPGAAIDLFGGESIDLDATERRLLAIAHFSESGLERQVRVGSATLSFHEKTFGSRRGFVQVRTDASNPAALETAQALFATALHAVFGGPELAPEQRRIVAGPRLSELSSFGSGVTIENARETVLRTFPYAGCRSDTATRELSCTVRVGHPLVTEVELAWPNRAAAAMERVVLRFPGSGVGAEETALAPCLTQALGPGNVVVVDHATGHSRHTWKLGGKGSEAELDANVFRIGASAWTRKSQAIVSALDACRR